MWRPQNFRKFCPHLAVTYRNQLILLPSPAFWGPPPSADVIYGSPLMQTLKLNIEWLAISQIMLNAGAMSQCHIGNLDLSKSMSRLTKCPCSSEWPPSLARRLEASPTPRSAWTSAQRTTSCRRLSWYAIQQIFQPIKKYRVDGEECRTGNGEKLNNSQVCCLVQLCLAAA